ncbi:MAG: glycosyl hydrolase family 17 protein [Lutibacter sp.]
MKIRKYFLVKLFLVLVLFLGLLSCNQPAKNKSKIKDLNASQILGNSNYLAVSYSGYRGKSRDTVPTIAQIKEDMKILSAAGIHILRTYDAKLQSTPNLLAAISQLKNEDKHFEMYVMLGAWIDCENAWTNKKPNHEKEDIAGNTQSINLAVTYAHLYPDIVKIIAVGNEAMVHWASAYYVKPAVILKWVNYLQELKKEGKLSKNLWITSSDNFASWGGGSADYHTEDLTKLIKAVDYISLHTYPYHDTHYNNDFWTTPKNEAQLDTLSQVNNAMTRSINYAKSQYQSTVNYIKSLGINKPIHIGETGWASQSDGFYGPQGSKATDEYKQKLFYDAMKKWTNNKKMSCFFFEAFDEQWKDPKNAKGSENHFGLITLKGKVKYALWEKFDQGVFKNLMRDGHPLTKTYQGNEKKLIKEVLPPPLKE